MSIVGVNESTTTGNKIASATSNQKISSITSDDLDIDVNNDDLGEMDFSDIASDEKPYESKTLDELYKERNQIDEELDALSRQKEQLRHEYGDINSRDARNADPNFREKMREISIKQMELNSRKEEIDNQINRLNTPEDKSDSTSGGATGGDPSEGHFEGHEASSEPRGEGYVGASGGGHSSDGKVYPGGSGSDSRGSTNGYVGASGGGHSSDGNVYPGGSGSDSRGGSSGGGHSSDGLKEGHGSGSSGWGHDSGRVVEGPSPDRMKRGNYN